MRQLLFRQVSRLAILASLSAACLSASPILVLTVPDQSGLPGQTVGWGFTLSNDTNHYIEITSSQFCLEPVSFPACTSADLGAYSDIISTAEDIILGPAGNLGTDPDSLMQPYDVIGQTTGAGSFTIDPSALPGAMDIGQIILTYDEYDMDPNTCGCTVTVFGTSLPIAADASVTVSASAVPEPPPSTLLTAPLAGLALWLRARRRSGVAGA